MGFNIKSTDKVAKKMFKGCEWLKNTTRIPIAKRANKAYLSRKVSESQARRVFDAGKGILGGNIITISGDPIVQSRQMTPIVLSHFVSIFSHAAISVKEKNGDQYHDYELNAMREHPHEGGGPLNGIAYISFRVNFSLNHIFLLSLRAQDEKKGYGAAMLSALYNVAKDLGIAEIMYVCGLEGHGQAPRFYYHMDYGKPIDNNGFWQLKVK